MIDSREYPPDDKEKECGYCGYECEEEFALKNARRLI